MVVLYCIHHGEFSEELFQSVPPSPFLFRTTHAGLRSHLFRVMEIRFQAKGFSSSIQDQAVKNWNLLPAHVFLSHCDTEFFKRDVENRLTTILPLATVWVKMLHCLLLLWIPLTLSIRLSTIILCMYIKKYNHLQHKWIFVCSLYFC